jgi:hypothetical protein
MDFMGRIVFSKRERKQGSAQLSENWVIRGIGVVGEFGFRVRDTGCKMGGNSKRPTTKLQRSARFQIPSEKR